MGMRRRRRLHSLKSPLPLFHRDRMGFVMGRILRHSYTLKRESEKKGYIREGMTASSVVNIWDGGDKRVFCFLLSCFLMDS